MSSRPRRWRLRRGKRKRPAIEIVVRPRSSRSEPDRPGPLGDALTDGVVASAFDGVWSVRVGDGEEIYRGSSEREAWTHAKRAAAKQRCEALLYADYGEVRLRADYRDDTS